MHNLQDRLQQALGSAYRIERDLGGGGMGRVFLAEETALGRKVAIKVLRPRLVADVSAERFAREIQLAARLQQANIVPVFSAGRIPQGEGQPELPYYIMPYVSGESLRQRLAAGPLSVSETVPILRDIARALAYAHAQGVVHRDIKPDNVLLSGGTAVVVDFGIAKALTDAREDAPDAGATLTVRGSAIGTPGYMAPEQAAGDPGIDHRADLYAFGILAHEMVAGVTPFGDRDTPQSLLRAHLSEPPLPLVERVPSCPPALAQLVMKCLEKPAAGRPQSADDVLRALDAVTTDGGRRLTALRLPRIKSSAGWLVAGAAVVLVVALGLVSGRLAGKPSLQERSVVSVLPLAVAGEDSTLDLIAEGLVTDVRTALAHLPGVGASTRAASQRYAGSRFEPLVIARKLGARAVVQGRLERTASGVQLTLQVTDTASANAPAVLQFGGTETELLGQRDTMIGQILAAMNVRRPAQGADRSWMLPTSDPHVYATYMRALRIRMTGASLTEEYRRTKHRRRALLDTVLMKEPRFAPAMVAIAFSYITEAREFGNYLSDSMKAELRNGARAELERALAIDPTYPQAHLVLGRLMLLSGDTAAALAAFDRAAESDAESQDAAMQRCLVELGRRDLARVPPSCERSVALDSLNPRSWSSMGGEYWKVDRMADAAGMFQRAAQLDPLMSEYHGYAGSALVQIRRYDEGIVQLRRALALKPDQPQMHLHLGYALMVSGRLDEAVAQYRQAVALPASDPMAYAYLGEALIRAGQLDEGVAQLREYPKRALTNPNALSRLAEGLWRARQFDEALITQRRVVAIDSNATESWIAYARLLRLAGRTADAQQALTRAIAVAPRAAAPLAARGEYLSALGRYDDAIGDYTRAIALDSTRNESWGGLAYTLVRARRADEALKAAQRAVALDSSSADAYSTLAMAYWIKGDTAQAIRAADRSVASGFAFDLGLLAQKIWFLAQAGRTQQARTLADSLTRTVRPTYSQLPLAIAYAGLGDVARASAALSAAAQARDLMLAAYALDDPIYDPLRQTQEYRLARERFGLVPGVVVGRD